MNANIQSFDTPYALTVGHGACHGHHGEILQGALARMDGSALPVLVTLPCRRYRAAATFQPRAEAPLCVVPRDREKARRAARLTLAGLGVPGCGGTLTLSGNIPARQGLGSSTADVVAAIRAVADALRRPFNPTRVACLAVAAETAADPLMFGPSALLFAQREGAIVERFAQPLPPLEILGIHDPANGPGEDTLAGAPRCYDEAEMLEFAALRACLGTAIARGDAAGVGAVATRSARLNQRFLRKPNLDRLEAMGRRHGALGIQIAHSGTAMGLIFHPADVAALREVGRRLTAGPGDIEVYHIPPASILPLATRAPAECRRASRRESVVELL